MKLRKYVKKGIVAILIAILLGGSVTHKSVATCPTSNIVMQEENSMSATKYGFTRFDTLAEFKTWLGKQNNYGYTGIQIHHTGSPEYKHFYKSNGTHEDELTRQYNMKTFHVKTNGWSDIAQHFTVFPNGKIVTGRSLSKTTAIGITGWNSKKICVEIYGNFDKGKDVMTAEQKEAVITLYGELCKKFSITPSTNTIRCHAWFTSGGTYLGTYVAGKSRKTCPGTNFMGFGNSKEAIANKFIPLVKEYMANGKTNGSTSSSTTTTTSGESVYRITTSELTIRSGAGTVFAKRGVVKKGESYTITEIKYNGSTPWGKLKSGAGWISLNSKYVTRVK